MAGRKRMKVLVACEESQIVTEELRDNGYRAYSCDIKPSSGNHPEWHIQGDVIPLLQQNWDMILSFPPCTHLTVSGSAWFKEKRRDGRQRQGINFFMSFTKVNCPRVMIENPIGIMSTKWRKPDQIIQPWQFGHGETKPMCLWLKGLPLLVPTNVVEGREQRIHVMGQSYGRSERRSKTYLGVAKAMAEQWGFC